MLQSLLARFMPAPSIFLPPLPFSVRSVPRSGAWPRVRREWLVKHPDCAACGGTASIQVHHKVPFHVDKSLELDDTNFITLCESPELCCHLRIGHLGNWELFNENVVRDAAAFLRQRQKALRRVAGPYPRALLTVRAAALDESDRLAAAIRRHRDERGDRRCSGDDHVLYEALPEGDTRPEREVAVTLENCARFIECRQTGKVYVSPQDEIDRLSAENARLRASLEELKGA